MNNNFDKALSGYKKFRDKYTSGNESLMQKLGQEGQNPDMMVVACSDSRVDPAILLQCKPGDIFVVRNIANIIPPYEKDDKHHGTSAALEFGVCHLNVKHLIILGHSKCGGVQVRSKNYDLKENDFIENWVKQIEICSSINKEDVDTHAKNSLVNSYTNCLSFPWIKERVDNNELAIHLWFFDIDNGLIQEYDHTKKEFAELK